MLVTHDIEGDVSVLRHIGCYGLLNTLESLLWCHGFGAFQETTRVVGYLSQHF